MSQNEEQSNGTPRHAAHFKQPVEPVQDESTGEGLEASPEPLPSEEPALAREHVDVAAASEPSDYDEFDPFASQEDPYPYETAVGMAPLEVGSNAIEPDDQGLFIDPTNPYDEDGGIGPDDTGDYLAAALASKSTLARKGSFDSNPTDTSAYYDVERYRQSRKGGRRHRGLKVFLLLLFLAMVGVAAGATYYVANIDSRLSENVTEELREELTYTEPEKPFYLLLLGVDKDQSRWAGDDTADYGADEHAYRSDSIMLCRIDPANVKVTMVSIHRDTLIDMGEYGQQKINAAYAFGGPAYTTKVVSEFSGVPISHYAEIDLDRFIAIVDAVGGVTVNLPVPVNDPQYTGLNLPAGEQTLNGTEAALLCRCRHGYDAYGDGDRFRAANQRMVFSAIVKKVLNSDPATIASTITTMADSVTTDMTVASILELATQMQTLNVETDIMTGMEPTDGVLLKDGWYEICLVDEWNKMMTRVDRGLPPYDEAEGEFDSTAGIAGGVGEEGERAAAAAIAADAEEAIALEAAANQY